MTRREALQRMFATVSLVAWSAACKSSGYHRVEAIHDLGAVRDLLLPMQHVRSRAMLVTFDDKGWAAMSTRCSYDGCDLSFQENNFLCPCCRSVFDHYGKVLKDPAKDDLPWFTISYADGHLYADTGKVVPPSYRYAEPTLTKAVERYQKQALEKGLPETRRIPDVLLGDRDETEGPMFEDGTPDALYNAKMGIDRQALPNNSR